MQQTPAQWRPPPQWTPPPQFRARSVPLTFNAGKTLRKLVYIIVAFVIITGLIPIACTVMAIVGSAATTSSDKPSRGPKRSKASPDKGSSAGGLNAACKKAKACCLIAMADQSTTSCDQIATLNDPKVCKQSLDGFRQLARTKGKRCQ